MSISFDCESCKTKIKATDSAGGKWGKCPHCGHRCYVPLPKDDDEEELTLAPLDEDYEETYKRKMRETYSLTNDLLHEKDIPEETGNKETDVTLLSKRILLYLSQMARGELDEAQATADKIAPFSQQAKKILDKIALSEMSEPELAKVPQQVLAGLIRTLRTRLS